MKKYIKNGVVKNAEDIVIRGKVRFIFHPTEELVTKQWNERTDIGNAEALDYQRIVYEWERFIGQLIPVGKIVAYGGKLWRVRQEHTVLEHYAPSLDTAALYEVIEKGHTGEIDDPIPYTPPMEIFAGKYYTENGVVYRCTRDSGTALSHPLSALVGVYVELT